MSARSKIVITFAIGWACVVVAACSSFGDDPAAPPTEDGGPTSDAPGEGAVPPPPGTEGGASDGGLISDDFENDCGGWQPLSGATFTHVTGNGHTGNGACLLKNGGAGDAYILQTFKLPGAGNYELIAWVKATPTVIPPTGRAEGQLYSNYHDAAGGNQGGGSNNVPLTPDYQRLQVVVGNVPDTTDIQVRLVLNVPDLEYLVDDVTLVRHPL